MQRLFFYSLITAFILAFVVTSPVQAGRKEEIIALQEQLATMRQQFNALSQRTGENNAESTVRISQLQQQNQVLTGQVESLNFELQQMRARLDQVTRVLAGESFSGLDTSAQSGANAQVNGAGPNATNSAPPSTVGAPATLSQDGGQNGETGQANRTNGETTQQNANASRSDVALPPDPNVAYQYASSFLLTGDYVRAREAFELYIETFPNSARLPDAQFRLGEIYLATGANADAAQAFITHIREYPDDPKAAEAYLKLGTSFARLEKKDQACQVYGQIRTKFPSAAQIIFQRSELEMQRLGCGR